MSHCQHCAEKDRQIIELDDALTNERAGVSQHKAEADLVLQDMGEKLAEAKRQIAESDEQRRLAVNQRDNAERNQEAVSKQNAMLRERITELEQTVCDFQAASMFENAHGDPEGILPEHVEREICELRGRVAVLEAALRPFANMYEKLAKYLIVDPDLKAAHDALEGKA